MKVLLVGDYYWEVYAKSFYDSFNKKKISVTKFDTNKYFKSKTNLVGTGEINREFKDLYYLFQNKYNFGPIINKMNKDLISLVNKDKPNLVFLYRDRYIRPSTLKYIKSMNIKIFSYNNDNPFSSYYKKYFWKNFFESLTYADHVFSYRNSNLEDYK